MSRPAQVQTEAISMQRLSIWFVLGLLIALAGCQAEGSFGPFPRTATPSGEFVRQAIQVTFAQLNQDPAAVQDKYIRISGSHLKLPPPVCNPVRGPSFAWSLADLTPGAGDWLRVDAIGFERAVQLLPEGTPMTLEGFWRLHDGPLGCGKNAPRAAIWYVEVLRIVEPNPLPGSGLPSLTPALGGSLDIQITPLATLTPTMTATSEMTATLSATLTPSATVSVEPLETPTETPTATVTLEPGVTPTITMTPAATATVADTPTGAAPPTETPEVYPPPYMTATPGGYP